MAFSLPVNRVVPLIDPATTRVYDCPDPYPGEGDLSLELPGPRARYERLAADLRTEIYAGAYPAGAVLPAESVIAKDRGISRALANRALQVLADEELVSQEPGRGTYVQARRVYRVRVAVPFPEGRKPRGTDAQLLTAVRKAARDEPAVREVEATGTGLGYARVTLLVEAADGDWAVHAAKLVVRSAGKPWSWEGWDLTLASYECAPAEARPA